MTKFGLGSSNKPYLDTPSVVEKILRDALGRVIGMRERQLQGEVVDILAEVDQEATALQAIFYGEDDRYQAKPWHPERHLGKSLVERSGLGGSTQDAVYRLMLKLVLDVMAAYSNYENDERDEADQEFIDTIDNTLRPYITDLV